MKSTPFVKYVCRKQSRARASSSPQSQWSTVLSSPFFTSIPAAPRIRHATSVHQLARAAARAMRRQRLYHTTTKPLKSMTHMHTARPTGARWHPPCASATCARTKQTPPSLLAPGVPRRVCPRPRPQHKSTHGIHKQQMRPNAMFYLLQRPPTATRARQSAPPARGAPRAPDARLSRRAS